LLIFIILSYDAVLGWLRSGRTAVAPSYTGPIVAVGTISITTDWRCVWTFSAELPGALTLAALCIGMIEIKLVFQAH